MRYGLISDVHANLQALDEVLDQLRLEHVDEVVCAGDLVGFGADPDACVERLVAAGVRCVAGNHDLIVLGHLSGERSGARARATQEWTRSVIGTATREVLAALPRRLVLPGVVVTHGSLDDPEEYVRGDRAGLRQLRRLGEVEPTADLLVLGHTHHAWVYSSYGGSLTRHVGHHRLPPFPTLINPGSVGQSRQREARPLARYAVLDTDARSVALRAVPYDLEGSLEALRRNGLPDEHLHLVPHRTRATVRRLRARLRG